jgi:hypothetical protein
MDASSFEFQKHEPVRMRAILQIVTNLHIFHSKSPYFPCYVPRFAQVSSRSRWADCAAIVHVSKVLHLPFKLVDHFRWLPTLFLITLTDFPPYTLAFTHLLRMMNTSGAFLRMDPAAYAAAVRPRRAARALVERCMCPRDQHAAPIIRIVMFILTRRTTFFKRIGRIGK